MFLTVHAAAGILIAQRMDTHPVAVFLLAFASHFILDALPHGDHEWFENYKNNQKEKIKKIAIALIIDITALFVIALLVYPLKSLGPTPAIAAGFLGAILPDCFVGLHELSDKLFGRFHRLHFKIHDIFPYHPPATFGLLFQIIILGLFLVAL